MKNYTWNELNKKELHELEEIKKDLFEDISEIEKQKVSIMKDILVLQNIKINKLFGSK